MFFFDDPIVHQRKKICNECPEKNETLNLCKVCKCLIPGKIILKRASCPLGKWNYIIKPDDYSANT